MKIKDLSGGMKRVVSAYIIIKSNSLFSLLDEPFTYISPLYVEKLKEIILRQKKKKGFIISEHKFYTLQDFADKLYIIQNNNLKEIENIDNLNISVYKKF